MKKIQLILVILFSIHTFINSQSIHKDNESIILTFKSEDGKIATLSNDPFDNYVVFRFGVQDSIEIEYPKDINDSYNKFDFLYSSKDNKNINYAYFNLDGKQYLIYDEEDSTSGKKSIGLIIKDIESGEKKEIVGKTDNAEGTLMDLRFSQMDRETKTKELIIKR